MKTLIKILFSLIVVIGVANGETIMNEGSLNLSPGDTTVQVPDSSNNRNYLTAISENLGSNIAVWYLSYSTMNSSGDFNISMNAIKRNFREGFVWDEDEFLGNQLMHPYHGAAYYTSARANGFDFWESIPFAFFGSLTWEYFFEDTRPSYGDIINTPLSGIMLGEMTYRISDHIINTEQSGLKRFFQESLVFILNPMYSFDRIIKGDAWEISEDSRENNVRGTISVGSNFFNSIHEDDKLFGYIAFDIVYGDIYDTEANKKPFDFFNLHTEFNIRHNDFIFAILASAVIYDDEINLFDNSKNIIGVYKEIDLLNNWVYKLATTEVGGNFVNIKKLNDALTLESSFGVSAILMGGTDSPYAELEEKYYNLGPGATAKLNFKLTVSEFISASINHKRYWINVLSGAEGNEYIGVTRLSSDIKIYEPISLGLEFLLFDRYSNYKKYNDYTTTNYNWRIFLSYNLK
jgi:hypothetical protein